MKFGDALKEIMAARGISRGSLARTLGVSKNHVSDLLAGQRVGTPAMIDRIGDRLQLPAEQMASLHFMGAQDRGYRI